jgi:hypothetical protein
MRIQLNELRPPPPPKEKDPLFALAMNVSTNGGLTWKPRMEYIHAKDAGDARVKYLNSEIMALKNNQLRIDIIGVSHVLGYFVNDTKGDILSV